MGTDTFFISTSNLILIEILMLAGIILVGIFFIRRRQRMSPPSSRPRTGGVDIQSLIEQAQARNAAGAEVSPAASSAELQALLEQARAQSSSQPVEIPLHQGSYELAQELSITTPVHLHGVNAEETRIVSAGGNPALHLKDVKDCTLSHLTIEGKIECTNSELRIDNCQIVANQDGICIDAQSGSTVTFSGRIRGEGGIAIRARGESQVILKQPYSVSDDDYVVKDNKSSVRIEEEPK